MTNEIKGTGVCIPEHWMVETLEEVTSKIGSGSTPRGGVAVYESSGVSFIRSQNVHDHEFRPEGLAYISEDIAAGMASVALEKGDVLFNITGDSIMRTTTVPEWVLPARVNQHVAIVRPNGRVLPLFLQKWLSLPVMKSYMLGHSSGGTRKAITKGHLQSFPIPIPPIDEQERIVHFLSAVDDKIESNRRTISVCQDLAYALFKAANKEKCVATRVLKPVLGGTPSRKESAYWDGDIPWASAKDIAASDGGYVLETAESITQEGVAHSAAKVFPKGSIVITARGTVGALARLGDSMAFNQSCYGLQAKGVSESVLFLAVQAAIEELKSAAHGTVFSTVNMATFQHLDLFIPTEVEPITQIEALFDVMEQKTREISLLQKLRDALLPELLSGRVQVSEDGKLIFPKD